MGWPNFAKKLWEKLGEIAEEAHKKKLEQGCECCGETPVCEVCYRCSSWNCNGGCIFCVGRRKKRF